MGRRGSIDKDASVVMEDDVVDLVSETDLSIASDEVEIVRGEEDDPPLSGRDSRRARREKRGSEDNAVLENEGIETIDAAFEIPIPASPMAPQNAGQVNCSECGSRFAREPGVMSTKCPVCGTKIDL